MRKKDSKFTAFLDKKYIPLDNRIKLGIAALLLILPIVVFYFVFYQANQDTIAGLEKKSATLADDIRKLQQKERNKPQLVAEVAKIEEEFERAAQMLPKEQEIPSLLKDISALGQNAGLDFLSFVPRPETPRDYYNEIPVDITVRGPYHSVGYFFDQISKLDRIVSVSNITMGSPQKVTGEMLLDSQCQLMTYRFTNVKISEDKKKK
ncbi:type 4a pilus biogenesis protein PilO [Desulfofustis glycolicus]|uniref:Type IV pilus assembly protein PilO n=1 Tax=Desulfofustis glycolicus DSM 9705 TaxID=1121409 RepID=A0A1M5SE24_9BACT|nr:type 4a pilus biogenesis protein PilO [Desulfofustis glycolicus]MCB2216128.1 type 4a pilus biogenesis protein PilO [Desulfobulbaceae bacterium]SHH36857.1 type IV pilus assembly protein PilO [Desulfofustis glycolicus DSM 9705]